MQRPRIGIPLCLDDQGRWREGHHYHYIEAGYAAAIEKAGGLALYLPIQAGIETDLVASLDGLLLPGGDDLAPEPEDADLSPDLLRSLDLAPQDQVDFDRALAASAIDQGVPLLGICYGMQLLARLRGGQLEAHLPTQRPETLPHRKKAPDARHALRIDPESQLARIVGTDRTQVNSLHHQGIRRLATNHRAVAWSEDELIEAFESTDTTGPFEMGVQWHPEKMDDAVSDRLFEAFVAAAREAAGRPSLRENAR